MCLASQRCALGAMLADMVEVFGVCWRRWRGGALADASRLGLRALDGSKGGHSGVVAELPRGGAGPGQKSGLGGVTKKWLTPPKVRLILGIWAWAKTPAFIR